MKLSTKMPGLQITTAEPSASRAKKSGTCRRAADPPASHLRQNGCDDTATTSGSKSSNITASRSTHDSKPTCSPVVANHHEP